MSFVGKGKKNQPTEDFLKEYARVKPLYSGALKTACSRFEILDDEFSMTHGHDPIHRIESRLKTAESCYEKLKRRGYKQAPENLKQLTDIAGVRVVCGYIEDIYKIAPVFLNQHDVRLLRQKDYTQKSEAERVQKSASDCGSAGGAFVCGDFGARGNTAENDFDEHVGESGTRSFV